MNEQLIVFFFGRSWNREIDVGISWEKSVEVCSSQFERVLTTGDAPSGCLGGFFGGNFIALVTGAGEC